MSNYCPQKGGPTEIIKELVKISYDLNCLNSLERFITRVSPTTIKPYQNDTRRYSIFILLFMTYKLCSDLCIKLFHDQTKCSYPDAELEL